MPRRRSSRRLAASLALAVAALSLSVAAPAARAALPAAHAATAPAPVAATGGAGGTLRTAFDADFSTLDPAVGYDPFAWTGEHAIFDGLLDYQDGVGQAGTVLVPRLAAAMPVVSDGGLIYTFTLRHGVLFQAPVSREVTSDDVRYSIERALSPKLPGAAVPAMYQSPFWSSLQGVGTFWKGKAAHVSGITAPGRYTISFRLTARDQAFLNVLAMPFTSVAPREWVQRWGAKFSDHALGTGPFLLQSWTHGQRMVLTRNSHYFRAGLPHLSQVTIDVNVADHLQVQRVQAGALDLGGNLVTSADYLSLLGNPAYAANLTSAPDVAVNYLAFNLKQKPFSGNLALRQAVNMAVNKSFILRLINQRGVPMNGILPPTMPGADAHFTYYAYNPALATSLLQKAGYHAGQLSITLSYLDQGDFGKVATQVQSDLGGIGIKVTLKPVESAVWYGSVAYNTSKEGQLVLAPWGQDYPDPSDFFDPILSCNGNSNAAGYCNPTVDQLGNQARATANIATRYALYRQMERLVMADAPWVPLYDGVLYDFHGPRLKGFFIHPVWPFIYADYTVQ